MSDIKTKETVKDIKVLDKSAAALRKVKKATVRTKDQIENLILDSSDHQVFDLFHKSPSSVF